MHLKIVVPRVPRVPSVSMADCKEVTLMSYKKSIYRLACLIVSFA